MFRAKSSAQRTDWLPSQLAFIFYGDRYRQKFGGPFWKEKGQSCSAIILGSSPGALKRRIHEILS